MPIFRKKRPVPAPGINTSSLPDIVFMLLFFFMVIGSMRSVDLKVTNSPPYSEESEKLKKQDPVVHIYIGPPIKELQNEMGSAPRIQLDDNFIELEDIGAYIEEKRDELPFGADEKMIVSIKADKSVPNGLISRVKLELRKANALNISYSVVNEEDLLRGK